MSLNYFNQFTLKHSMFCNILITFCNILITFYLLNTPLQKTILKTWNVLRVIKCFAQIPYEDSPFNVDLHRSEK